jgi:protein SCO1/2
MWRDPKSMAVLTIVALLLPRIVSAAIDPDVALARSQAVVGTMPADFAFMRSSGGSVRLADLRGRPLVLSLVYTSCPHVCPAITTNLKRVTDVAAATLGVDAFNVATIGFDTAFDTPQRMASYARTRGIDEPNWYFLAADVDTVAALVDDVGFTFEKIGGGFDHLTQVTLLDADGRIVRQVYGADMEVPALVEPLKQLAEGARFEAGGIGNLLEGVRLLCTVYDPALGRYRFDYAIVMTVFTGLVCMAIAGFFVFRLWRTA